MNQKKNNTKSKKRKLKTSKPRRSNDTNKFKKFEPNYLHKLLLQGFIHDIMKTIDSILPIEIEKLCNSYLPAFGQWKSNKLVHLMPMSSITTRIYEKYEERYCLLFNAKFNNLYSYKQQLICRKILVDNKRRINSLQVFQSENIAISKQLWFSQYVLLKAFNNITSIDLSYTDFNDNNMLYLCQIIENVTKYYKKRGEQRSRSKVKKNNKLILEKIDLSHNIGIGISDKYISLMLETINKYLPKIKELNLSSTNITNKSIAIIMEYNIFGLQINLTNCKGVTLNELNKYQRSHYGHNSIPRENGYCCNLIYYQQ